MATYSEGLTIPGLVAGQDLANYQYYVVKFASTANAVIICSAATDSVLGILCNDPAATEEALVQCNGVAKALAEASVTAGEWLAPSSTGRVKTTTTSNDDIIGKALDASSAAGDLIRVLLTIGNF